jgi:hypothetical protein
MANSDPTKDPAFQTTLKNLLSMKPKPHSEMKVGKKKKRTPKKTTKARTPRGIKKDNSI